VEHEEQAEELEREAEKLDEHSERVGEHIDETRREWEAKEDDPTVPGAQPPTDEHAEGRRGDEDSPGVPGEEDTGTGNPDAAGAEEGEDSDTA
jgi:hypothetical protein